MKYYIFQEKKNTNLQLVASGVLLSCNPDRLIIKRIVLSGHPYKVNYMLMTHSRNITYGHLYKIHYILVTRTRYITYW